MHWRAACITARADVYVMMMGSVTDDQKRHSPDYIDEADVQSVLKNVISNIVIMSNPPGLLLHDPNAHIVFSVRTICNPEPRHYIRYLLCQI